MDKMTQINDLWTLELNMIWRLAKHHNLPKYCIFVISSMDMTRASLMLPLFFCFWGPQELSTLKYWAGLCMWKCPVFTKHADGTKIDSLFADCRRSMTWSSSFLWFSMRPCSKSHQNFYRFDIITLFAPGKDTFYHSDILSLQSLVGSL